LGIVIVDCIIIDVDFDLVTSLCY